MHSAVLACASPRFFSIPYSLPSRRHQRSYLFAQHYPADIPRLVHVEDDHGQVVVLAEAHGGQVHHLQPLAQNLHVGDLVVLDRVLHQHRIGVVDSIDLGSLEQHIGLDLHGSQAGRCIGGEEGIADTRCEDHHAALFQVAYGAAANVRLGDLIHEDSAHHTALDAALFQCILHGDGVDDRREHAHVVSGHAVHLLGLLGHAAEDVASPPDYADFHAQRVHIDDLAGNLGDLGGVQAEAARAGQHLTR